MEQNLKQHTLSFEQGLTTTPSDIASPDTALSQADGIVFLDGEYKALQNTKEQSEFNRTGYTLALVHLLNSGDKNILYYKDTSLFWKDNPITDKDSSLTVIKNIISVVSIGNTLIIDTSDKGLYYALWKNNQYKPLGNKIPEPNMTFMMRSSIPTYDTTQEQFSTNTISSTGSTKGIMYDNKLVFEEDGTTTDHQEDYNNLCVGLYEKLKKRICRKRGFNLPFFIRYAVKLYDGSYTLISNPILMYPSVNTNNLFEYVKTLNYITCHSSYCYLKHKLLTSYEDWGDIIKGVDVFMSDPVEVNDLVDDCSADLSPTDVFYNGIYNFYKGTIYSKFYESTWPSSGTQLIRAFALKSDEEIKNELISSSAVYYKLFEAGSKINVDFVKSETLIKKYTLENITSQDRLDNEDYYSHCTLYPKITETFNRRLNLAQVKRGFYNGFSFFCAYNIVAKDSNKTSAGEDLPTDYYFPRYEVTIDTPDGEKTVVSEGATEQLPFHWFYYPDPRATKVTIYFYRQNSEGGQQEKYATYNLTEHPGLNGAYWMGEIPSVGQMSDGTTYRGRSGTVIEKVPSGTATNELIANYVLQSEVDNPFTFFASGYVRVGQGTIIGMAGLTTALSQDAYKISTTLVFTTQGIWALKINDEGQYVSVAPPFSREVCSYADTITMTDNAVFFVSKKGLMCVTGESESLVVCVSKNLKDSDFVTFCNSDNCRLAYDYKEQLLYVTQIGQPDAYIYSITTATWTYDSNLFGNSTNLLTAVTDYPDTYLQNQSGYVFSFLNRPNRNEDDALYDFNITSRPLKLSGSLIPESIRRVKQLLHPDVHVLLSADDYTDTLHEYQQTHPTATSIPYVIMQIEGSNDLITWTNINSTGGAPYRFFRLSYKFRNMLATHTFAATVLLTQQRHTNRFL